MASSLGPPPGSAAGSERPPASRIPLVIIAVALGCIAVLLLGIAWNRGRSSSSLAPASATPSPSAGGFTIGEISKAVVNINGDVRGGFISGTGMIVSANGIVLTNNHVVAGTTSLTGQVNGAGPHYTATVLGVDRTHDVAVVRLEGASGLPTVTLDTTGVVAVGDHVTALGNALGANGVPVSATGSITSLDDTLGVSGDGGALQETLAGLIQFNALIEPGDSGGPLLNEHGHVIGMDTAGSVAGRASTGPPFGAAIPIRIAADIEHDILAGIASPYIEGPHSGDLGVDAVDAIHASGALVRRVTAAPTLAAGLVAGDVITAVGGTPVTSAADLASATQGRRAGDGLVVAWTDPAGGTHEQNVILASGPPA